ncbi:MAG: DUF2069 domain-containing protein [Gammaproteobacteria bacterium]|nr:DUF2069 domain-containing protein [Gammaproteobacteria bacterium]
MSKARGALCLALLVLAGVYAAWFGGQAKWIAMLVFALPPALLAMALLRGHARAGFWAGVLALLWFPHGVMVAWTRPPDLAYAGAEIVLALAIVFAASLPGLRARFAKPR